MGISSFSEDETLPLYLAIAFEKFRDRLQKPHFLSETSLGSMAFLCLTDESSRKRVLKELPATTSGAELLTGEKAF